MGIFDYLRKKTNYVQRKQIHVDAPRDALEVAEQYCHQKDYSMALTIYEKAFVLMEEHRDRPTVSDYLPYIECLQDAGEEDEAWKILKDQMASNLAKGVDKYRDIASIEWMMAKTLRQGKRHCEAVVHWACSSVASSFYDYRTGVLDLNQEEQSLHTTAKHWFSGTRKPDAARLVIDLIVAAMRDFPRIDLQSVAERCTSILDEAELPELYGELDVDTPRAALKTATQYNKSGDHESAIRLLRKIYPLLEKDEFPPTIQEYLRLPRYLRDAGRSDEAWGELNRLLVEWRGHPDILPMDHAAIYKSMRIHLMAESDYGNALRMAAWSRYSWAIGLHKQGRRDELQALADSDDVEREFKRILRKAEKEEKLSPILTALETAVSKLPKVAYGELAKAIDGIWIAD